METTNFIQDIKNTIISKLNDYSGTTNYACDLSSILFEGENVNGSVFCNTYQTKEFIKANFDLFGDLVEYCKDNFDMVLNPFQEPEKAHVLLLLEASQSILSKCKLIDENWNNEIELTNKVIKKLTKQINDLQIDENDLF